MADHGELVASATSTVSVVGGSSEHATSMNSVLTENDKREVWAKLAKVRLTYMEEMNELYGVIGALPDVSARPESGFPGGIVRNIAVGVHGCDEKLDRIGARLEQSASRKRSSYFDRVMLVMIQLCVFVGLVVLVDHAFFSTA